MTNQTVRFIEKSIFAMRWMLIPVYLGLAISLGLYIAHFVHEVIGMAENWWNNVEQQNILLLFILELADMALICQFVVMSIQGGFAIFIKEPDSSLIGRPRWLSSNFGTSEQKVKMGMSVMGIMLVNLTKSGVSDHVPLTWDDLLKKLLIMSAMMIITYAFCRYNLMMHDPRLVHHAAVAHKPEHEDHGA
jgi:uncharacterized protein (TIGR00645 family)